MYFGFERRLVKGYEGLWATLGGGPEPLAFVVGDDSDRFVTAAASWKGVVPSSIGELLTVDDPDGWEHPERLLRNCQVLTDLEILYWPTVMADPLRLVRSLSRRHPLIVHWPGQITDRRAAYSEPGRRDFYDEPLHGEVVVRPRPISSSTDIPYDLEIAR